MAEVTASLIKGKTDWGGVAPVLRRSTTGMTAEQWWRIENANDESEAMACQYLPEIGKPFSNRFDTLRCVEIDVSRIGGTYDTASQAGVHYSARVNYATPQFNGRQPEAIPGTHFTRFRGGTTTIQRRYDARIELGTTRFDFNEPATGTPGSTAPIDPINSGQGYTCSLGTCEFEVVSYYAANQLSGAQLTRMIQLAQYGFTNLDTVRLPPLYGVLDRFEFDPGQLKYQTFALGGDRGIVELVQLLAAGPDFFELWSRENAQGEAVFEPVNVVKYPAANFAGLWP